MIKNIIFDFDGVILDSAQIKEDAFKKIFEDFPQDKVDWLLDFHRKNGGVSRFEKIRLMVGNDSQKITELANRFGEIVVSNILDPRFLIQDTMRFIQNNYQNYKMHIASGAEENELKYIANRLDISKYFLSIHGSPTPKHILVKNILENNGYKESETVLVGDSTNDFEAAKQNGIKFIGYNNPSLHPLMKSWDMFPNK
jgi:HAD superfamily hydrolase (TIGR01549 family)